MSFWGQDQLNRWPEGLLRSRKLSPDAVDYLSQVGLPRPNDWSWEIDRRVGMLPLLDQDERRIVIAYDGVVPICIDRSNEERVVAVEEAQTLRFVNSSVMHFGASLHHFRRHAFARPDDGSEDQAACRRLFQDLVESDPAAVAEPGLYWTSILAQIGSGRL